MIFAKEDDLHGNGSTALVPLALATNCGLDLNVDSFDATSKDSGSWQASMPGMKSWSMNTDNLYCPDYDVLMALTINRTLLTLYWIPTENTEALNQVTHTPTLSEGGNTYKYYYGTAWINNVSASAPNADASNYNVGFTGTGALTPSDTLPSVGIGASQSVLSLAKGGSAKVVISNATGVLSAVTSNAKITATIANGVVTIAAASDAVAGPYNVAITDAGTSTTVYVYVTVLA